MGYVGCTSQYEYVLDRSDFYDPTIELSDYCNPRKDGRLMSSLILGALGAGWFVFKLIVSLMRGKYAYEDVRLRETVAHNFRVAEVTILPVLVYFATVVSWTIKLAYESAHMDPAPLITAWYVGLNIVHLLSVFWWYGHVTPGGAAVPASVSIAVVTPAGAEAGGAASTNQA